MQVTQSGLLEQDDIERIKPTDNGVKPTDPTNQPDQKTEPLKLDANGLPIGYSYGGE